MLSLTSLEKFILAVNDEDPLPHADVEKLSDASQWLELSIQEFLFLFFLLKMKNELDFENLVDILENINGNDKKPRYFDHIYLALHYNDHLFNNGIYDLDNYNTLETNYGFFAFCTEAEDFYNDTSIPDKQRIYIEMLHDEYFRSASMLIPANTTWKTFVRLQNTYNLIHPKVYEKVERVIKPLADHLNAIDAHYVNIGDTNKNTQSNKDKSDFRFDIIRYYQRYSEPFQDPFTKNVDKIKSTQKKLIKDLDTIFRSAPTYSQAPPVLLFRGVRTTGIQNFVTHSPSFKSTTADIHTAEAFIQGESCCLLALSVDPKVPLVSVNIRHDIFFENEYLLPRNAIFVREPWLDLRIKNPTKPGNIKVYGYKVKLDPAFDFEAIDEIEEDQSLFNMQGINSFFLYMLDKMKWIISKKYTHQRVIYDYLTLQINTWLYNNHYYDKIEALLTDEIESIRTELIILSYTDLVDVHDLQVFFNVVENLKVNDILTGRLYHQEKQASLFIPKAAVTPTLALAPMPSSPSTSSSTPSSFGNSPVEDAQDDEDVHSIIDSYRM